MKKRHPQSTNKYTYSTGLRHHKTLQKQFVEKYHFIITFRTTFSKTIKFNRLKYSSNLFETG